MTNQAHLNQRVADECEQAIKRARLGYLLANDQLTQDDADTVIFMCQPIAGWFPLETFSVSDVIEGEREYPEAAE